jgi:hypothetical protein
MWQPIRKVLGFIQSWYYQAHSAAVELRKKASLLLATPVVDGFPQPIFR